jgi:hypothetical protein
MVALARRQLTPAQLSLRAGDRVWLTRRDETDEVYTVAAGPIRVAPCCDCRGHALLNERLKWSAGWVIWLLGVEAAVPLIRVRPLPGGGNRESSAEISRFPLPTTASDGAAGGRRIDAGPRPARRRFFLPIVFFASLVLSWLRRAA